MTTLQLPRLPFIVIGLAALLLIADALRDNPYFDPDLAALLLSIAIGGAALAVAAGPKLDRRRLIRAVRRLAGNLLVSLVATALALVAAEFATRWIYRDVTTTSDDRGYFSHRWLRSGAVSLNRYGFRDREIADPKPPGRFRIAVIGDSLAFGNGIAAEQRFSSVMQQALSSRFEVLNFGTPGNNSREHVSTLQRALPFSPDFVLLQWFINDVEEPQSERPTYSRLIPSARLHEQCLESSALYSFLNTWWTRRQARQAGGGSYADYMRARYSNPQADAVRVDRQAMRALVSMTREAGVGLGIVLFPDASYDLGADYPFDFLHVRVLEFCTEYKLTCVDLRPEFARVKRRLSLWANPLDAHPSALANTLAAASLLKAFEPIWLQPRPPH